MDSIKVSNQQHNSVPASSNPAMIEQPRSPQFTQSKWKSLPLHDTADNRLKRNNQFKTSESRDSDDDMKYLTSNTEFSQYDSDFQDTFHNNVHSNFQTGINSNVYTNFQSSINSNVHNVQSNVHSGINSNLDNDYSNSTSSINIVNRTRFNLSPIKFNNYLGFVFENPLDDNLFTVDVPNKRIEIVNKPSLKPYKKDKQAICFAFLFGKCNKNANDCMYNHTILNPAAWNFIIIASLLREGYIWINSCQKERNNSNKNSIWYNNIFDKQGCSFWHDEYHNNIQSNKSCKFDLKCRDLECGFYHSMHHRELFPEVIAFLKTYTVDARNKYAVTYDDRSLYNEKEIAKPNLDLVVEPPPTIAKKSPVSKKLPAKNTITFKSSQDARVQTADSREYLLQNEFNKLKLEKSKLENELRCQIKNYHELEDAYRRQSQLCLDLSKQIEALKTERDFTYSATLRRRNPAEK